MACTICGNIANPDNNIGSQRGEPTIVCDSCKSKLDNANNQNKRME